MALSLGFRRDGQMDRNMVDEMEGDIGAHLWRALGHLQCGTG